MTYAPIPFWLLGGLAALAVLLLFGNMVFVEFRRGDSTEAARSLDAILYWMFVCGACVFFAEFLGRL